MNKHINKIFLLSLAAVLILLLSACSSIQAFFSKIGLGNDPGDGGGASIGIAPESFDVTCLAFDNDGNIRLSPSGDASTATLSVTVKPDSATNKSITFSSNKTSVFTCAKTGANACTLTAKGTGVATLTITAEADTSVKSLITVKVEEVHLQSLELDNEEGTYAIGKTFTIRPSFIPYNAIDKELSFTSSDLAVATVSESGLIETLSAGTCQITITSATNEAIYIVYDLTVVDYSTALLPKNLEVDGIKNGSVYNGVLYYDEMAGGGDVTVEIRKGGVSTICTKQLYGDNFSYGRFIIPSSVASLSDAFSSRIRYSSEETWTEYVTHDNYTGTDYTYFDSVSSGAKINRYFNSLKDMSETLEFFCTFEPIGFETEDVDSKGLKYDFEININTGYTAEDIGYSEGSSEEISRLLTEVTSMVSGGLGASVSFNGIAGERNLKIRIITSSVPNSAFPKATPSANKAEHPSNEMCTFVGVTRAPTYEGFATESTDRIAVSVSTSEQLLWAVENGLRPVPASESAAEDIYTAAKGVLRSIIKVTMTDKDKIHAIYDWLALNVTYDTDLLNSVMANQQLASSGYYSKYYDFYLESVFLTTPGISVCDGISKAFSLLSAMEGIDSVRVNGHSYNGEASVAHAWNKVRINGCWYEVDATWASKSITLKSGGSVVMDNEFITHAYLFASDVQFADHIEAAGTDFPEAKDSLNVFMGKDNYFETGEDFTSYVAGSLKTEYNSSVPSGVEGVKKYAGAEIYFDVAGWESQDFLPTESGSSAFTTYFGNQLSSAGLGSGYIYTTKLISERYILLIIQET